MHEDSVQMLLTITPDLAKKIDGELGIFYKYRQDIVILALKEYFDRKEINLLDSDSFARTEKVKKNAWKE